MVTRTGLRATNSPKDTAENPVACAGLRPVFSALCFTRRERKKKLFSAEIYDSVCDRRLNF